MKNELLNAVHAQQVTRHSTANDETYLHSPAFAPTSTMALGLKSGYFCPTRFSIPTMSASQDGNARSATVRMNRNMIIAESLRYVDFLVLEKVKGQPAKAEMNGRRENKNKPQKTMSVTHQAKVRRELVP
jgi:hypothetical protein